MPPPSIQNDEFQIFRAPLLRLPPAYQSCFHPFHNSLGSSSTSCGSLKAVNNSYLPAEIPLCWLLVWWSSGLQANILREWRGMWSSYLVKFDPQLPVATQYITFCLSGTFPMLLTVTNCCFSGKRHDNLWFRASVLQKVTETSLHSSGNQPISSDSNYTTGNNTRTDTLVHSCSPRWNLYSYLFLCVSCFWLVLKCWFARTKCCITAVSTFVPCLFFSCSQSFSRLWICLSKYFSLDDLPVFSRF